MTWNLFLPVVDLG